MKRKVSIVIVLLALAGLISVGIGAQPAKGKGKAQTGKRKPAPKVAAKAVDAAALYKQHCQKCHAPDGKGIPSLEPPDLTDAKWQADIATNRSRKSSTKARELCPASKTR